MSMAVRAYGGYAGSPHRPFEALAGVGLRAPHYERFLDLDRPPATGWLEAHAENYFDRGGVRHRMLLELAERYPISIHGVALSLGSAEGLDADHLDRLAALVAEIAPPLVSEHLAWSRMGDIYYNDLLPLPLTEESLDIVSANIDRVQARLNRPILVENPSGYLPIGFSTLEEAEFLARLVARTGCGLLLDVNNLFISAANLNVNVEAWLAAIPSTAIGEIHLAGHALGGPADRPMLIDTHGAPVSHGVWSLYETVIRRFGPRPTLVEWDSDLPPLETLLEQATLAQAILDRA
ncbi:MAG TPA: DUF692 domain-containing protein [Caulobacteraceae bacterium]|nr:DUF692 domain-containing protein [Caulobacteraceae bacterium]